MPTLDAVKKEFETLLCETPSGELYKKNQIKRTGQVDGKHYSEIYAKCLLKDKDYLTKLEEIHYLDRQKSYKVPDREKQRGSKNAKRLRAEERFAYRLYDERQDLGPLGAVFYYQVPLKESNDDRGAGKIDLVSTSGRGEPVYLIELKYGRNGESLLKAVLEIHTYYRLLNRENFITSFDEIKGRKPEQIRKAVLLGPETKAYEEARCLQKMPNLKALIQKLKVNIFCYAPEKIRIA